jgi:hypothetical protein
VDWSGPLAILAIVIIIGLVLKFGQSSTNLGEIATTGLVKETNALTLSNIGAQSVSPVRLSGAA